MDSDRLFILCPTIRTTVITRYSFLLPVHNGQADFQHLLASPSVGWYLLKAESQKLIRPPAVLDKPDGPASGLSESVKKDYRIFHFQVQDTLFIRMSAQPKLIVTYLSADRRQGQQRNADPTVHP